MTSPTPKADEFYVGYLTPAPPGVARRVRAAVLLIVVVCGITAAVIGARQSPAGSGVWNEVPVKLTGLFVAEPCPMLRVEADGGKRPRTILLVGEGKCGALEPAGYCGPVGPRDEKGAAARSRLLAGLSGQLVTVSGTMLTRDGREILELAEGERAVIAAPADQAKAAMLAAESRDRGEVTLRGVIVDPKCYLGAMKPGDGKAHRACAVRCISGGIPPVLIVAGSVGPRYILIADTQGRSLREAVIPYVSDLVEVPGRLIERDDVEILCCDPGLIARR